MTQLSFVPDNRYETAPPLPTNRPPTRRECFAYYSHVFKDVKDDTAIAQHAREVWAWRYVEWVNGRGWRKQPDWVEGAPVIDVGLPAVFDSGGSSFYKTVRQYLDRATTERRAA